MKTLVPLLTLLVPAAAIASLAIPQLDSGLILALGTTVTLGCFAFQDYNRTPRPIRLAAAPAAALAFHPAIGTPLRRAA